jgi:hypothetical protein
LKIYAASLLLLALILSNATPSLAREDRFFLRASGGASIPFVANLSNELKLQGADAPKPGYSFGVSLGRTFLDQQWSLEAHFSAAFYPEFDFTSNTDSFPGRMQHYDYCLILRRRILPEGIAFQPTLGVGVGYGLTNLIAGGGKMGAYEAIAVGSIETRIRENLNLSIEGTYYAGLQQKKYERPFLENFETDVVKDHFGNPLEDRFNSIDVRIGITVFLRPRHPE